jgi:hypothetical protein
MTALQELYKEIEYMDELFNDASLSIKDLKIMISNYYLEKEKQQIIGTFEEGRKYPYEVGINHAEDYYNNTFQVK